MAAENLIFEFSSFTPRSITLVGDSHLRNGAVQLTRPDFVTNPGSGALLYDNPISLFDPNTNTTSSFSTSFSFSIWNLDHSSYVGDGIAFFLSPTKLAATTTPGRLGLPTSSGFVAVEFEVCQDPTLDIHKNQVGFSINSSNIVTVDLTTHGIDLNSGGAITSWIDYNSERTLLTVFLSDSSSSKPLNPVLTVRNVDLSEHFKDKVYVGFSASSVEGTDIYEIYSWSFRSFDFVRV